MKRYKFSVTVPRNISSPKVLLLPVRRVLSQAFQKGQWSPPFISLFFFPLFPSFSLFLYLFTCHPIYLLVFFFVFYFLFIAISSRSLWRVVLFPNSLSHPPENLFLIKKKKNPYITRKESHIFQRLFHPYFNTLEEFLSFSKSYQFQNYFSSVDRFPIKKNQIIKLNKWIKKIKK